MKAADAHRIVDEVGVTDHVEKIAADAQDLSAAARDAISAIWFAPDGTTSGHVFPRTESQERLVRNKPNCAEGRAKKTQNGKLNMTEAALTKAASVSADPHQIAPDEQSSES